MDDRRIFRAVNEPLRVLSPINSRHTHASPLLSSPSSRFAPTCDCIVTFRSCVMYYQSPSREWPMSSIERVPFETNRVSRKKEPPPPIGRDNDADSLAGDVALHHRQPSLERVGEYYNLMNTGGVVARPPPLDIDFSN